MAEGDGAAVHVHDLLVGAEHLRRIGRDRGKRLVDLDAMHVADRLARALERHRAGLRGRAREKREIVRDIPLRDYGREWLQPAAPRELLRADDDARRTVVHPGRVAGWRRPLWVEHGLQRRELLVRGIAAHAL